MKAVRSLWGGSATPEGPLIKKENGHGEKQWYHDEPDDAHALLHRTGRSVHVKGNLKVPWT